MAEIRSFGQSQNCPSGNSVRHYRLRRYASDATTPSFVVLKATPKHISDFEMEKVINLGIPHVGEQIFASMETQDLVQSLQISEPWKILAKNVLINRWKGKMFGACISGETEIVQLLLENCNCEESGLDTKDDNGRTAFMIACIMGHKKNCQVTHF